MANPSAAHEPSMEEILASIRQIISEDGEGSPASRNEPRNAASPEPEPASREERRAPPPALPATRSGALAEGEPMMPKASESAAKIGAQPAGPAFREAQGGDFPAAPGQDRQPYVPHGFGRDPGVRDRHLLSDDSDAAVSGAFSVLAHTILAQNARTLEDLVAEMLKPMLKDWLDDNLPSLVERIVQEEIHRVSRGRR